MKRFVPFLFAALSLALGCPPASAQQLMRVTNCGDAEPPPGVSPGTQDTSGRTCVTSDPATSPALTPVVSGSLEASHVLLSAAGKLFSVNVSNLTGGASGNVQVFNATSAPGDGAVTPLICAPVTSNGVTSIAAAGGPPVKFSAGITAVVSSATSCFTKTTGVLTAFISALVQ